ncbi:Secretory lipase [Catalinimonas alkaloidigena]|uniref:Secretory lipase n=1 Tax=Catalinimonas alkaloidigena TaxID=1075417 RepID=A0A1G9HSY0_9BACT|nr:lipase family protein [Catalinimonas alkaloidigena]SDL16081.1 Secretory lipase [Catalinimonas alkaloidigena]
MKTYKKIFAFLGIRLTMLALCGCTPELTHIYPGAPNLYLLQTQQSSLLTHEQLAEKWPDLVSSLNYDIDLYRITYRTTNTQGDSVTSSAAILVPRASRDHPVLIFQAPLNGNDLESPSHFKPGTSARIAEVMASNGFITVIPDVSVTSLAYHHATTSATHMLHLLRATQEFCYKMQMPHSDRLFLAGYDAGAYATLATLKLLEQQDEEEFEWQLIASSVGGGAYDLLGTMQSHLQDTTRPLISPARLALQWVSYNALYTWERAPETVFQEPYAQRITAGLFDGTQALDAIEAQLTPHVNALLTPQFLADFQGNGEPVFKQALRDQSQHRWLPQTRLRLYHGTADQVAPSSNAEALYNHAQTQGATSVSFVPFADSTHASAYAPFVSNTLSWFGQD